MTATELSKGTSVKWNSSGGVAHGRVVKELTSPTKIKNHKVSASKENPQLLVETKSGAKAAHKPEAVKKESSEEASSPTEASTKSTRKRSSPEADAGADSSGAKKKKKTLDYVPTEKMAENAKLGLKLRKRFNRGGTEVGVNRANQLAERRRVSTEDIKSMASYFARHEVDKSATRYKWGDNDRPSAGYIAWLLWGGDEGKVWAKERREALRAKK